MAAPTAPAGPSGASTPAGPAGSSDPAPAGTGRPYRFADVARSEWTKFRSVRSTYWTFLVGALFGIGFGALGSFLSARHYATDPELHFSWRPVTRSLFSLELAQLAFAVLGVITVTSEYSTGMIRSSLTAVPRRSRMMLAKLTVFSAVAVVLGEAIAFTTFGIGQALFHGQAPSASLGTNDALRTVVVTGLDLLVIGVLGAALGLLLRHAAAAISIIVAMIFIVPGVIEAALPSSWARPIEKWWPTNAGEPVSFFHFGGPSLGVWTGFIWFAVFTVVVVAVALVVLERRDA